MTADLWTAVLRTTERALASKALRPIAAELFTIEDGGIPFQVHLAEGLREKTEATRLSRGEAGVNPFLPYDEELFVGDVSTTHVALLNKFNVVPYHWIAVTRSFEEQESLLTLTDFDAMWRCLREVDALFFYNAGRVAGASQRHKHLQFVPLPLGELEAGRTPVDEVVFPAPALGDDRLGLQRATVSLGSLVEAPPQEAARLTLDRYHELRRSCGSLADAPYNLVATREWMMYVPRTCETWESINVNGLGFAGSLLVKDETELGRVRDAGPLRVLRSVSYPPRRDPGAER